MRCMSATDEVESGDEQEVGPRTRRSWVVLVAASMSALLTLSYPPLTIAGLVFILEQGVMPADAVAALWLSAITTTGLLVATVGLWLLRPFGWRCALAFVTIAVVDQARVLMLLTHLSWGHPGATRIALRLLLTHGLLALFSLVLLALLAPRASRRELGVYQEPLRRRRRALSRRVS